MTEYERSVLMGEHPLADPDAPASSSWVRIGAIVALVVSLVVVLVVTGIL